ncbi:MAG: hypothetical protein HKN80_01045, partial [Acidimicrobiia bacterium]|nr:hypothetical protein [Acidimicrobiia bacterium]
MELIWLGLAGGYIYSVVVCFQKGKKVFGWLGVGAIIVPLAPILIWFPLVGSLRRAKPDSRWVEAPNVMAPKPTTAIASTAGGADEARIVKAFLDRAVRAGAVTSDVRESLLHFLHQPDLTGQVRVAKTPVADPRPEPPVPPKPVPAAPPPRPPAPARLPAAVPQASRKPPPKREPSQLMVQVRKAWDEVSSEMAV